MSMLAAAIIAALVALAVPPVIYHYGEVDLFWFVVLEVAGVVVSAAAIVLGFLSSIDFSK